MDGSTWGAPVAQGSGQTPITTMAFPPASAKYIRINQTGSAHNGEFWGIARVSVLQVAR